MSAPPETPQAGDASTKQPVSGTSVVVCVKWAVLHAEIDPIRGTVQSFKHNAGFSDADLAAVETALRLAEDWSNVGAPTSVVAICVGPEEADEALRNLVACGVSQAIRVSADSALGSDDDAVEQPTSSVVAELLADRIVALQAQVVLCGDVSADRGSGSVPAFLAHRLGAAQALGLIEVNTGAADNSPNPDATVVGRISGVRRLDGARREVLHVTGPAVVSVEGAVADLRRASLPATIAARSAVIEVHQVVGGVQVEPVLLGPWRPRARVIAAPDEPDALGRIVSLTGAKSDRTPARTEHLDPASAAAAIVDQLTEWGYLGDETGEG